MERSTQFGKRFYNTILLATIQSTVAAGSSRLAGGSNDSVNLNSSTQPVSDLATETLKNSINIPAILRKILAKLSILMFYRIWTSAQFIGSKMSTNDSGYMVKKASHADFTLS
jgi:hypothetical protein